MEVACVSTETEKLGEERPASSSSASEVARSDDVSAPYVFETCPRLRAELRRRGLPVSGVKASLIARLEEADTQTSVATGSTTPREADTTGAPRSSRRTTARTRIEGGEDPGKGTYVRPTCSSEGGEVSVKETHASSTSSSDDELLADLLGRQEGVCGTVLQQHGTGTACDSRGSGSQREGGGGEEAGGRLGGQSAEAKGRRSSADPRKGVAAEGRRPLAVPRNTTEPEEGDRESDVGSRKQWEVWVARATVVVAVAALLLQLLPQLKRRWAAAALLPPCAAVLEPSVWAEEVLPPGSSLSGEWVEMLQLLTSRHLDESDVRKAPTILLAARTESAASTVAAVIPRVFPLCSQRRCTLVMKGAEYSLTRPDAAGRMQAVLVAFLQRCPQGLIVMEGLEQIDLRVVPVLFAALSEQGQFEYNGDTVTASGGIFVFTATLTETHIPRSAEEDIYGVEQRVKAALLAHFMRTPNHEGLTCSSSSATDTPLGFDCLRRHKMLTALRRRFQMVAPVRDEDDCVEEECLHEKR